MKNKPQKIGKNHATLRFVTAVARAVDLTGICVVSFRGERKGNLTETLSVTYGHRTSTTADRNTKTIHVLADFRMTAKSDKVASPEEIVVVELRLLLQYHCPIVAKFSQDALTAFGNYNGVYNAWPYWREFLQSSTVRMGLPPLTAPVFRVASALRKTRQAKRPAITAATTKGNTR